MDQSNFIRVEAFIQASAVQIATQLTDEPRNTKRKTNADNEIT